MAVWENIGRPSAVSRICLIRQYLSLALSLPVHCWHGKERYRRAGAVRPDTQRDGEYPKKRIKNLSLMPSSDWVDYIERELDSGIESKTRQGGGDFAEAWRVGLVDGRSIFVKTHLQPPVYFFTTEAAGLEWLRDAGAARIPEVLVVSDNPPCLALEWIEVRTTGARCRKTGEQQFGRELAALHLAGAAHFGRADGRTTGSLALPNGACSCWVDFYAQNRLLPLARLGLDRKILSMADVRRIEDVAKALGEHGARDEKPARLHGDLWAGNRVIDQTGNSWLVDPAAHGGHREFDLAMMRLFGGYDEACFSAYAEVSPLSDGWQDRVPLHQLAPLIVHAIKFGGSYLDATRAALASLAGVG
ncbi:MAG: fructosamine kinase family protein [Granulosicoccus sp.]